MRASPPVHGGLLSGASTSRASFRASMAASELAVVVLSIPASCAQPIEGKRAKHHHRIQPEFTSDTLPNRMTELPTTFGKYYLTEKLATGGMAEIYLAKIIGPGGFE